MTSINTSFLLRSAGLLATATALALLSGCGGQSPSHQMPPAPVGVMVVQPQHVPLVRSATGRLSAYRSADVRARVSGVLLQRTYAEGTHVDKGQVLFKIDPAPLKATLNAAEASLAQARATYTNSHVAAQRVSKLAPKGYVSQSDLDNAEAAERTALAAVKAAKAQVENAQINLGYATVRAPIAGRAGKQQVTEGALVGQGSATLLTTVRQVDPLYLNFSMPVSELQQIRADQANGHASLSNTGKTMVHITLPDGSTYPQNGTLDFAGASVDPSTGAVTLRAIVPNPKHVLLPGMYAQLKVNLGTINHAYLIPQNAIQRDASGAYVLTVGKGNKVMRQNVVTGYMQGGKWIVTSGIKPGDRVIVSGIPKAKPGSEVKPTVESNKPKAAANHAAKPAAPASAKPAQKAPAHPSTTASQS
ncbi:MAG TPA: efflux RND transporter periplasmic adaptor subunit [Oleiagrimonas sp.]|nr:efflux RND transporter periplasmic adaptor subunit [Oleiagrimonas sp.]